jgi:hypothetical protein
MTIGIGAGGIIGIALEDVAGTYQAPTKFIPIESESLAYQQDTQYRRPIRQSADIIGAVAGNAHIEGDISMEALEDCILYFLHTARATAVKSGVDPNWTYTFTPNANATPAKTMSITVVRNGITFGYTGCVVSSFTISIEDGMLKFSATMQGLDEETDAVPVPVWPTTTPFAAGQYSLQIPTAAQVFDADTFEFQVEDNAEAQFRLKSTGRGASFISFGERNVTVSTERDFQDRDEYELFKSVTSGSLTLLASKGTNNSVQIDVPTTIKDSYEVNLGGQGDLVRASVSYNGVIDGTGKSYQITVKSQEVIV